MDSFDVLRKSITDQRPPSTLFEKPSTPARPLDSAIWRFLKAWQDQGRLGIDHAILFRQIFRWGADQTVIGNLPTDFIEMLRECSVNVDSSTGRVNCGPWTPSWITEDVLPERGIDTFPIVRHDVRRLPAESYVRVLRKSASVEKQEQLTSWRSAAQKEAAWSILTAPPGSTNLAVLPTGMGKSLCFQLLSIFGGGLTVVVVPTVALAIDQCSHARMVFSKLQHINPVYFAADDPEVDSASVVDQVERGQSKLVFTSPEALVSGSLHATIQRTAANGTLQNLVIDEAHIISSWGVYFRIDFQLLAGLRRTWKKASQGNLRTFLFTATLTPEQKREVLALYSDSESQIREFTFHSLRPEISYFNEVFEEFSDRQRALNDCLYHLPRPAILYTTRVDQAESLFDSLLANGFQRIGCFTGDTQRKQRRNLLNKWRQDEIDLMVATSAFGLGVDKSDVRVVIHSCLPEDLNRYYQEVGRGGRDGYTSVSVLIPTAEDIRDAKSMAPKLLGTDLIQKRWRAMWETREVVNQDTHEWKLRLNTKRLALLGDRTYKENVQWNKRLVLQLDRAQQIRVMNSFSDAELTETLHEYQQFIVVQILDGFNPDSLSICPAIVEARKQEADQNKRGFEALYEHLHSRRCLSRILGGLYGDNTLRCCGGCACCRMEDRSPTEPPTYIYGPVPTDDAITIVEHCPQPNGATARSFAKLIRKCVDIGFRRFVCAADYHTKLADRMSTLLGPQALYRLDACSLDETFSVLDPEPLIAIHIETPSKALFDVTGAASATHLLCGPLGFADVRYLMNPKHVSPLICASPENWS